MDNAMKYVMWLFAGAIFVLIVTHPKGFSTAAGTLFTGVNSSATILTGSNMKTG